VAKYVNDEVKFKDWPVVHMSESVTLIVIDA
jgi:hypothetical protein